MVLAGKRIQKEENLSFQKGAGSVSEEDRVGPLGLLFDRQLSINAILSLLERKPFPFQR